MRPALLDDGSAYRTRLMRIFKLCDVLKLSCEDLAWIYQGLTEDQALDQLGTATAAPVVVLTRGEKCSSIRHDGQWLEVPAEPVAEFKDSIGAGDTYMASMLSWLIQRNWLARLTEIGIDDKRQMAEWAAKAAAINCRRQGCSPPSLAELGSNVGL